jgi:hypothetical protein
MPHEQEAALTLAVSRFESAPRGHQEKALAGDIWTLDVPRPADARNPAGKGVGGTFPSSEIPEAYLLAWLPVSMNGGKVF